MNSPLFEELVKQLTRLPGVGSKSATRMAFHLLSESKDSSIKLAQSIDGALKGIKPCSRCFNLAESTLCPICQDPKRDEGLICVVSRPADILVIEKSGSFRGLYHVLGGTLSPLDGIGPDSLNLDSLKTRLQNAESTEIILALGGTSEAEATCLYIERLFKGTQVSLSRLARGIPVGADLEYLDERTLFNAMELRTQF
jgi:recombination protein RecR